MRVSRFGARHRDVEHPGEGAELGVRRPALDCSGSERWLVVELVWWWGWWFPVGWEFFGFEWDVDPPAPGAGARLFAFELDQHLAHVVAPFAVGELLFACVIDPSGFGVEGPLVANLAAGTRNPC